MFGTNSDISKRAAEAVGQTAGVGAGSSLGRGGRHKARIVFGMYSDALTCPLAAW